MTAPGPLRLALAGASGKMGRMIVDVASRDGEVVVAAQLPRAVTAAVLSNADAVIDFSRPEGTLSLLPSCVERGIGVVIGTTGFGESELAQIARHAEKIPVVYSANMSMGVNVTAQLVEQAARAFGMDADIEVFEAHHKRKVDAPSGTALMLGRAAAQARGQTFADVAVYDRHGVTGERREGSIGFTSVRAGDIVGDHTVYFVLNGERIEITHRSNSRATYAQGAIRAAKWLQGKPAGLYDMRDVLGLDANA